jgi:hypothetical protein
VRAWFFGIFLVVLSVAFRLPILLNAHELNSDVAIVGLQAKHVLAGEFQWFLWGSGYQSSLDALWASGWFALFGATPLALLASALSMHIALTSIVYQRLYRRLDDAPGLAFCVACVLVFTTASVHSYALYPPRQVSLTLVMAGICLADGARDADVPWRHYVASGVLAGIACFADPYARLLYPAMIAIALCGIHALRGERRPAALGLAFGAAVGLVPDMLLRHSADAQSGPMGLSFGRIAGNARILWDTCGPWALGHGTYAPTAAGPYERVELGPYVHIAQIGASCVFLAACMSALILVTDKRVDIRTRQLGIVGAMGILGTAAAFLLSEMVYGHFAMRYLAAITLFAPFALAPLTERIGRWMLPPLGYTLASTALSGYLSFGEYLKLPGQLGALEPVGQVTKRDDEDLLEWLRGQSVSAAMADYWAAYRLTFLSGEGITFAPKNASEDRRANYRVALTQSGRIAYVYDARRSFEGLDGAGREARALGRIVRTDHIGAYTVFLIAR